MKDELREAFNAGMSAQKRNDKRDKLLEEGTKQCPEESTFETWILNKLCTEPVIKHKEKCVTFGCNGISSSKNGKCFECFDKQMTNEWNENCAI